MSSLKGGGFMHYSSRYLTINLDSTYIDCPPIIFLDWFKISPSKRNRSIHKSFYLSFGLFRIKCYMEIKWGYKKR